MEFIPTSIPEVLRIIPKVHEDDRGFFLETFRKKYFSEREIDVEFVQDNMSASARGVIRGLHYQIQNQQAKLLMVPKGKILDVAVDLRRGSPWFGKHVTAVLSEENKHQLFIPTGFAHGYAVLADETLVSYKCSDYYNLEAERGLYWNDPALDIDWPLTDPVVSEKDRNQPRLNEIPTEDLFTYQS
ncbi:dTDP-4-dehydrorhamnose 3,5-epimerase [Halalkalibaculum sp. DA3122]|uniref:dTDP-4-dehydrorhamnose 3,5-epimerase n=1 Tax=unclassified Halalkalibaculum TaxID=2964617 RepID=UPI0037548029